MAAITSFLAELDEAVARGNPESCLRALWHAADILIAGTYSEDQIWTFGEVIGRLAQEIETSARAKLAGKLACSQNAPYALTRQMASDDCIDVAWPILSQSERLDTETLIACAKNKSQQHLLAISRRQTVPEAVTDVLVVRGSPEVVTSVASNAGASLSKSGFLHLVRRSEGDSILAESVGLRKDIPRHLFHQLIAKASEEVRQKLKRERPDIEHQVHRVVVDVTGAIHARFGPASKDYFTAKRTVAKLHERGELTEDKVFELAHSLKFNETTVALSLLWASDRRRGTGIDREGSRAGVDPGQVSRFLMAHHDGAAVPGRGQLPDNRWRAGSIEDRFPPVECQSVPGGRHYLPNAEGGGLRRLVSTASAHDLGSQLR